MIAELKPLLVIAQEEIQSLRAETARLREELEEARAQLAACAAGPWHDAAEVPPKGNEQYAVCIQAAGMKIFSHDTWIGRFHGWAKHAHVLAWALVRLPRGTGGGRTP